MPDGVLFGSSNAHRDLRKMLVDENQLEAVISMPSGVFKPYAGVSTAILIFTKGGQDRPGVVLQDGVGRLQPGRQAGPDRRRHSATCPTSAKSGLPERRPRRTTAKPSISSCRSRRFGRTSTTCRLSRYRETEYEEAQFDPPQDIMKRLRSLDNEVSRDMDELETMLK